LSLFCNALICNHVNATLTITLTATNCAKSRFGIKAKPKDHRTRSPSIVQRADLESRQSWLWLILFGIRLCKEQIWNQGKAPNQPRQFDILKKGVSPMI
jgi:hypothetical protein